MLVYFLVAYLQTIDRLLILAIFLVYSGLLGLMVYHLEYPPGLDIHKRKTKNKTLVPIYAKLSSEKIQSKLIP